MSKYKITVKRTDTAKCEGLLKYFIDGVEKQSTTCWEKPDNLIPAKSYTGCSAEIMVSKKHQAIFIPDGQTGKTGIFVHPGSKPSHSDGCIVCSKAVVDYIYNSVPKSAPVIDMDVS